MKYEISYSIFPLGDSSITVSFPSFINEGTNDYVLQLFKHLKENPIRGMIESTPSYAAISIHFDVFNIPHTGYATAQEWMTAQVEERIEQLKTGSLSNQTLVNVPVCFIDEFCPDLETIGKDKRIRKEEIIELFLSPTYRVYMLGFLPGFPYLGTVDEKISMPRKSKPVPVLAGSVAITGAQAGIYPVNSPGGWHIIGRTPLMMLTLEKKSPTLFNAGDHVRFYQITKDEYQDYQSRNSG